MGRGKLWIAAWKLGWRVDWRRQPPPSSYHRVLCKDNSNPGWQHPNIASRLSCLIPGLDKGMSPRVWERLGLTLSAYTLPSLSWSQGQRLLATQRVPMRGSLEISGRSQSTCSLCLSSQPLCPVSSAPRAGLTDIEQAPVQTLMPALAKNSVTLPRMLAEC